VRNNEVFRITPRFNEDVNSYWMCDYGRINTYKFINSKDRISGPYIRKEGTLNPSNWSDAVSKTAAELKSYKKNEIAFIGSARCTCEDNYILSRFAKSVVGTNNIDFIRYENASFEDDILRKSDMTPNSLGAELVGINPGKDGLNIDGIFKAINEGRIKVLYIIEDDLIEAKPELENVFSKLDLLIVHSSNMNKTTALADIVFPAATYAEKNGTFVNFQGRIQRIRPAVETEDFDRTTDGMSVSRLDKFGTKYDRWAKKNRHDTRSSWKIISLIALHLNGEFKYSVAEEVFNDIAKSIKEFKGLNYSLIGEQGMKLNITIKESAV
jgi:NADH-quinone oxidoreductase subunit G